MKALTRTLALLGCAAALGAALAACDQELGNGKERFANSGGFILPDAVVASYNLDGTEDELEIISKGAYVDDNTFGTGKVFKNDGTAQRTSYLLLPENTLQHSAESKEMTIGFWVKVDKSDIESSIHCPIFTAYHAAPSNNTNTWPCFILQSRLLMQVNCSGVSDFLLADRTFAVKEHDLTDLPTGYSAGYNAWKSGDWQYYTCTITETEAIIYIDGTKMVSWKLDGTDGHTVAGFFANSGDTALSYVCLGGNQAWDWADNDSPFLYAKFTVWNVALTGSQVKAMYDVR